MLIDLYSVHLVDHQLKSPNISFNVLDCWNVLRLIVYLT